MRGAQELIDTLRRIDGRGYKAYRDLRGAHALDRCSLHVDHVQGDPFAAPSRLRVRVAMETAELPDALRSSPVRRLALGDYLARRVRTAIRDASGRGGDRRASGKSNQVSIDAGGQEVLERSALVLDPDWVEARIEVGLPANGRRVLGSQAEELLTRRIPAIVEEALLWQSIPADEARNFVHCVENQEHVRGRLRDLGLVAFVGNGAILPRESGASDRPLPADEAVPFRSPAAFQVEIPVPNPVAGPDGERASLVGMGLPRGVTLIVGGGYHGKSTLLRAIERGVHPHVPGDGREWVVSDPDLVKIRAEDGRSVSGADIEPFIGELPGGRSTRCFTSELASGSTSQAAAIVEAVEMGAAGLLLDEDTSATNFMVRDARMQALVRREHEPITPFVDRVRELHDELGVSSVIVMGGCGDYFDVADRVISLREYVPEDVTDEARAIAASDPGERRAEAREPLRQVRERAPLPESFDASRGRRDVKISVKARDHVVFGTRDVDLRGLEQLVDASQTRAIGLAMHLAGRRFANGETPLRELLAELDALLDADGLDVLDPYHRPEQHPGNLARPRRFEIAGAINRLRGLRVRRLG